MATPAKSLDQEYRVTVSAIVGGPLDLRKNQIVPKSEIADWAESLVRLGAVVAVTEGTGGKPHSPSLP